VAQFRSTHDLSSGDPAALTWCNACGPPVRSFQTGGRRTTFGAPLPVRNSSLEKGLLLSSTRACKPTMPCVQACHVYAGHQARMWVSLYARGLPSRPGIDR
jgi:hypothetical protein